jgi:hypothetical protein
MILFIFSIAFKDAAAALLLVFSHSRIASGHVAFFF